MRLRLVEEAQALYDAPRDANTTPNIVQMFSLAVPGPLPEEGGGLAEGVGKTTATLRGNVDPEGAATTYQFQFLSEAQFKADGESFGAGTQETPESVLAGADFAEHPASAAVSGLTPDTTYRFRLVAFNANAEPGGVDGETVSLRTEPPLRIDSTSAGKVSSSSVVFSAQINPLGDPGSYRFEYLSDAAYRRNIEESADPFKGAARARAGPGACSWRAGKTRMSPSWWRACRPRVCTAIVSWRSTKRSRGGSRARRSSRDAVIERPVRVA